MSIHIGEALYRLNGGAAFALMQLYSEKERGDYIIILFFFLYTVPLTVATPCTCAVVPSGSVMMGLLGSTCMKETVPSAFCDNMVCVVYCRVENEV